MGNEASIGTILRMQGGFYFIEIDDAVLQCTLPGKHKRGHHAVFPGDRAEVQFKEDSCVVHRILPRSNVIHRPGIANLNQLFIVASVTNPPPDFLMIDRLLCIARYNAIEPFLIFTKWDIPKEKKRIKKQLSAYYSHTGDPLFFLGLDMDDDAANLTAFLSGKVTGLAGNSGVGKSTFINRLTGEETAQVEAVSDKLARGRHTTRTITLFPYAGGYIADTPGFNVLDLPEALTETDLARLYPDYMPLIPHCKFSNCLHHREPNCAVRANVENGALSEDRYQNYLRLLNEIQTNDF